VGFATKKNNMKNITFEAKQIKDKCGVELLAVKQTKGIEHVYAEHHTTGTSMTQEFKEKATKILIGGGA